MLLAALSAAVALSCAPASASPAASTTLTDTIDQRRAEQAMAQAQLDALRMELSANMAEYVDVTRRLHQVESGIADVEKQIAAVSIELSQTQAALMERSAQMYRGARLSMLDVLLDSTSVRDFVARSYYLSLVIERDTQLLRDYHQARTEALYLRNALETQMERLTELQLAADVQRSRIESDLAQQQKKAASLGSDVMRLLREQDEYNRAQRVRDFSGSDPIGSFNPDMIISNAKFRAASSPMSVEEIQAFLDRQPGVLKTYRAPDHAGVIKSAAQMIHEASVNFDVSPAVILVTLQKEQSLLAKEHPTQEALDWAMGAGKADSRTYYEYKGFGNQIWWGAQKLDKNANLWSDGAELTIDGSQVRPANEATFGLYRYTPHLRGVMSFWTLYWRYFGDPLG